MSTSSALQHELEALADPEQARHLSRFFKTGPGQYGAGDQFFGIKVPVQRGLAKKYRDLPLLSLVPLLDSPWHEMRLCGLLIVQDQYRRANPAGKTACYEFLLAHLPALNNWDLVDVIVPGTIGDYLFNHPAERACLTRWIQSGNLWERRIALLASFAFIRQGDCDLTFALCTQVMSDSQDLIHKSAGWMLREAGKRKGEELLAYLESYAAVMPRTMLRYALEKLSPAQRLDFMARRRQS